PRSPSLHRLRRPPHRRHHALQLRLWLRRVPRLHHHSLRRRALQHRQPLLRARLLQHLLTARWSSLLRSLTTRSASTRTTTVSRCGTVRWRTFSAISRCRDWCLTTWRRSCTSRATTASLGLLQRPRDTRHGVPRCSRRWTRLRRTALGSLLISLAVTVKWVFKLKRDEAGTVVKHKARLVARGFVQQEGVDFDDAFAPVARME